jgi:hypothetical protein
VLCYLQGKTQEEAARELGCSLGVVRGRLMRGRRRPRARLARRGVPLSAVLLAAELGGTVSARASLPAALAAALAAATPRGAVQFAGGGSPGAAAVQAVLLARAALAAGVPLLVIGLGAGAVWLNPAAQSAEKGPPASSRATSCPWTSIRGR